MTFHQSNYFIQMTFAQMTICLLTVRHLRSSSKSFFLNFVKFHYSLILECCGELSFDEVSDKWNVDIVLQTYQFMNKSAFCFEFQWTATVGEMTIWQDEKQLEKGILAWRTVALMRVGRMTMSQLAIPQMAIVLMKIS